MARPPRFCADPAQFSWSKSTLDHEGDEAFKYDVTHQLTCDYYTARQDALAKLDPVVNLAAHRAQVRACTELVREKVESLPAVAPSDGGYWVLWARLGFAGPVFEALRLDAFDEGRVIEFGGAALARRVFGEDVLARLVLGRDPRGLPLFSVFCMAARADMTGAALRCETPEGRKLKLFPRLDRIDGYPELGALFLNPISQECAILVVTRNPALALRRLRRWIFPCRLGSFEHALDRHQRILWRGSARLWATYRMRRALSRAPRGARRRRSLSLYQKLYEEELERELGVEVGTESRGQFRCELEGMTQLPLHKTGPEPTLHQLALERVVDPTALLPALDTTRPWTRPQTQTPATRLTVQAALALRVGDLLLLRTYVSDDRRKESSYRYLGRDFKNDEIQEIKVWQTAGRAFPVLEVVDPLGFDADGQLGNNSPELNRLNQVGPDWNDDELEPYLDRLADLVDAACFVNDGPVREQVRFDDRSIRRRWMLGEGITVTGGPGKMQPRRLEHSRVAEWIIRCSQLDYLPHLERECLFLSLVFPVLWEGAEAPAVVHGVLQVRVPLAAAWHGLDLSGLFAAPSAGLFVATCEAGVLACIGKGDGRTRAVRLELDQVYSLDGVSALEPALLLRANPDLPALSGARRSCVFGPVSHLIVTGRPDLRTLLHHLPPVSGEVDL